MLSLSVFSSSTEFRKCAADSVKCVSEGHSLFLRENGVLVNTKGLTAVSLLQSCGFRIKNCCVFSLISSKACVLNVCKHMHNVASSCRHWTQQNWWSMTSSLYRLCRTRDLRSIFSGKRTCGHNGLINHCKSS